MLSHEVHVFIKQMSGRKWERKKRKQEHGAFPSVEGGSLVLHVPWFQHAACLSVGVCIYDQSVGQVHLVVAGEGVFIKLFRKPHPHSSEHDGAPATGGSRISLSPRCNVGIMAHTAPSCHPQQRKRHHACMNFMQHCRTNPVCWCFSLVSLFTLDIIRH